MLFAKKLDELEQKELDSIVDENSEDNMKQIRQYDSNNKVRYLKQLEKQAEKFLTGEALEMYSPKYKIIMETIFYFSP